MLLSLVLPLPLLQLPPLRLEVSLPVVEGGRKEKEAQIAADAEAAATKKKNREKKAKSRAKLKLEQVSRHP